MLHRKYVFETKSTKRRRKMTGIFVFFSSIIIFYLGMCLFILAIARFENNETSEMFYRKAPDLLVILTGDSGRIPFGLKKAVGYRVPRVYITGVYATNSIQSLLEGQDPTILNKLKIDRDTIDLDYMARNTIENGMAILKFIHENKGQFKNIIIVSSDYHILRIKMILNFLKNPKEDFQFFYLSPESQYQNQRNIKIILLEVIKTLKAFGFLILWDKENMNQMIDSNI